jgi:hypothetical protein
MGEGNAAKWFGFIVVFLQEDCTVFTLILRLQRIGALVLYLVI